MITSLLLCVSSAKVYIDKKLKRNSVRAPDDLIGDILHQSRLSKKELYAAITELQIGGVETVSNVLHHKVTRFIYRNSLILGNMSRCLVESR